MILLTLNKLMNQAMSELLTEANIDHEILDLDSPDCHTTLDEAAKRAELIITQTSHPSLPTKMWVDIIGGLSRSHSIHLVSQTTSHPVEIEQLGLSGTLENIYWLLDPQGPEEILEPILNKKQQLYSDTIVPILNPLSATYMLKKHGSLSILSIDASEYKSIAREYGEAAYKELLNCFQNLLTGLWGGEGSFRNEDQLVRSHTHSNTYYVLLEPSRTKLVIPRPGDLERLADRVSIKLSDLLWEELTKSPKQRKLPSFLQDLPEFSIGHATVMNNPCSDSLELIEKLISDSEEVAIYQQKRNLERHKELIQTLVQTDNLLAPRFQAVFNMQEITEEQVKDAQDTLSIKPLYHALYGFEALIRVNIEECDYILGGGNYKHLDIKFLRPDIMFNISDKVNLSLELDQACIRKALSFGEGLPGKLLVNILPRNFYHIEKMPEVGEKDNSLIFEVSEKEAISNYGLLKQVRNQLENKNHGIAIDDFGKGYAGLDRLLQIKPNIIKLDRSLIQDIHKEPSKKAFVQGLVSAAKTINSTILAEGVEKIAEMKTLQELEIDLIQGFLVHKPEHADNIMQDIQAQIKNSTKSATKPKAS